MYTGNDCGKYALQLALYQETVSTSRSGPSSSQRNSEASTSETIGDFFLEKNTESLDSRKKSKSTTTMLPSKSIKRRCRRQNTAQIATEFVRSNNGQLGLHVTTTLPENSGATYRMKINSKIVFEGILGVDGSVTRKLRDETLAKWRLFPNARLEVETKSAIEFVNVRYNREKYG